MKRYFRAKKRSKHRDRSSSAYSQKDVILKEKVEVVRFQNEAAKVRCSAERQQLKGKESQQYEPSESKVKAAHKDAANKSIATTKVIERNDEEKVWKQKLESRNEENEIDLHFKQKPKSHEEHEQKTTEEERGFSTENVSYSDNLENESQKLKSNSFDKHSCEAKNKECTYEIIEEIMERREVTYFIMMNEKLKMSVLTSDSKTNYIS